MKKKTYIALISALTISGAFLLNGCSFELPGTDATVSAGTELSAEKEILTDGNLQLYSRWYDASGEKLANATVTITNGNETVFEGTTERTEHLRCAPSPEIKSSVALLQMNPVIRLQNLIFSTKFLTVMIPSWYIQPTENPTH